MTEPTTYAADRVTFRRTERGEQVVTVDGVEIGRLHKAWARVGGWGWARVGSTDSTQRTLRAAAKPMIAAAVRDGRIQNGR